MHGHSLLRTIDVGVIVIVTVAIALLGLLAWAARLMDKNAFDTESAIVQRQLGRVVAEFRADIFEAGDNANTWLKVRPLDRGWLRRTGNGLEPVARDESRVGLLFRHASSRKRLEDTLALLERLDEQHKRVDFVLLGPRGGETLALVARTPPSMEPGGLLVGAVDFAALSVEFDSLSINLRPAIAASTNAVGADGQLILAGADGAPTAILPWKSRRISVLVGTFVLPILSVILTVGFLIMMMLRRHWGAAREGFLRDLKAVETIALTDPLTSLPNRRALFDLFRTIDADPASFPPVSVLVIDLDGFKWVNEHFGHRTGDNILTHAAAAFRDVLGEDVFLARLGGDIFVALLPFSVGGAVLKDLHARLTAALRQRVKPDNPAVQIGINAGIVSSAQHSVPGEELLRLADLAVSAAKTGARGSIMVYDPSMREEKTLRRNLELDLRAALDKGQIVVFHQPIVDALSGRTIVGYESLVRWKHPVRGFIAPGEFIPVAEQSDLILLVGNHVLDRALAELKSFGDRRISVNATGRQFLSDGFVGFVQDRLTHHGVEPSRLCLELTETSFVEDGERVSQVMEELRDLGVKIAIDDFGVGYSSLSYLLRFKFDVLKIDRDFIVSLDDKEESPMIVTSVVSLARSLGMSVVGEGVENAAQHRFLASAGCNALQGYLFSRPLPLDEFDLEGNLKALTVHHQAEAA